MPASAIDNVSHNFTACGNKALATTLASYMTQLQTSGQLAQIWSANQVSSGEQPAVGLPTEDCPGA
jgi:hypothetical protein